MEAVSDLIEQMRSLTYKNGFDCLALRLLVMKMTHEIDKLHYKAKQPEVISKMRNLYIQIPRSTNCTIQDFTIVKNGMLEIFTSTEFLAMFRSGT